MIKHTSRRKHEKQTKKTGRLRFNEPRVGWAVCTSRSTRPSRLQADEGVVRGDPGFDDAPRLECFQLPSILGVKFYNLENRKENAVPEQSNNFGRNKQYTIIEQLGSEKRKKKTDRTCSVEPVNEAESS